MTIKQKIMQYSWDIAYGVYNPEVIKNGLKSSDLNVINNPFKNKWFADPFILEENSKSIQFLVEEFDYSIKRGRIARLLIDKQDCKIKELSIILDLPTHLSFPAIYRMNGNVYVHPENSASGSSFVYLYDQKVDKLIDPKLILNEPITDAVIQKEKDHYYLYATKIPESNGCFLYKYKSSNLFGPYQYICKEFYDKNTARMAGMFLEDEKRQIRPAQNCFGDYGKEVILFNGHEELCRLKPFSYKYAGIHTFNTLGKTFVIDLKKYDYPILYKFIRTIKP